MPAKDLLTPQTTRAEAMRIFGRPVCFEPCEPRPRYPNFPRCTREPKGRWGQCDRHVRGTEHGRPQRGMEHHRWRDGRRARAHRPGEPHPDATKAQAVVLATLVGQAPAGRALGINPSIVKRWCHGRGISERATKMAQDVRDKIAEQIFKNADVAAEMIGGLLPGATLKECLEVVDRVKVGLVLKGEASEINKTMADENVILDRLKQRAAQEA